MTNRRLRKALSLSLSSLSLSFFLSIPSICSNSFSIESNFRMSSAAVLGPTPRTPGILSLESPMSPITSTTQSGPTPNFSMTSSLVNRLFFIVSSMLMCGEINCIISLSLLTMVTFIPSASPCLAKVPMMSSASKPGWRRLEIPNASTSGSK